MDSESPWMETDRRPDGVSDETVEAVGRLSEAVEWVERARGRLYDFHQMMGHADLAIGDAADQLRAAGHEDVADHIDTEFVGRNVVDGRWTFQIVEEFDGTYWSPLRAQLSEIENDLTGGRRHVFESEMKDRRRTDGEPHHERRPPTRGE